MKQQKLPSINYGKLSHERLRTLLSRILTAFAGRQNLPDTVTILITRLTALLVWLDKILLKEKASQLTKVINEMDDLRDRAYRHLLKKIRLALEEYDASIVAAAEELVPVINQFGADITTLSFAEETARLELAFSEFRIASRLAALTKLGFVADLERTENHHADFEDIYKKRTEIESSEEELPLLRSVRRESIADCGLLMKVSELLYEEKHESFDKKLFDLLAAELSDSASLIKTRETLAETAE